MEKIKKAFVRSVCAGIVFLLLAVTGCSAGSAQQSYLCADDLYMGGFISVKSQNLDGGSAGLSYAVNAAGTEATVALGSCAVAAVSIPNTYTDENHVYSSIPVVGVAESGFADASVMTSVTLPTASTFTRIGSQAFKNTKITAITIPASVNTLNPSTFLSCQQLATVTFNGTSSVSAIGDNCFFNDIAIHNIQLPVSCSSIGESAFKNCIALERMMFPKSAADFTIGAFAFDGCENLGFIYFSSSVKTIGDYAFKGCTNGQAYFAGDIPDGYSAQGWWDYTYNANENSGAAANNYLTIVDTNVGDMGYGSSFYYIDNGDGTITIYYYDGSKASDGNGTKDLTIPGTIDGKTVIGVGKYALKDHTELKSVTFPNSLTTLGMGAFQGCNYLATINFGTGLTTIGDYAFYTTNNNFPVTSLSIPASVVSIGSYAFYNFRKMTSLTFTGASDGTSQLTSIGDYAFRYGGYGVSYSATNLPTFTLTLPGTLTSIGTYAFSGCYFVRSLVFTTHYVNGSTVSPSLSLATYSFDAILYLGSVSFSANVTSIGNNAFNTTSNTAVQYDVLHSIAIPATVTTLGSNVFNGRTRLTIYCEASSIPSGWNSSWAGNLSPAGLTSTSVSIPYYLNVGTGSGQRRKVTNGLFEYVEDSAGSGTSRYMTLSRFLYNPTNSSCSNVTVPASFSLSGTTYYVDNIGAGSFFSSYTATSGRYSLTKLALPAAVKSIGDCAFTLSLSFSTFYPTGGSDSQNGDLPTSLTSLGTYCFGSTPITKAHIPSAVTSFGAAGSNPFLGCFLLTELTMTKSSSSSYFAESNIMYAKGASSDYTDLYYGASGSSFSNPLRVPDGCVTIDPRSFMGARSLAKIVLPYSVKTIGTYAFDSGSSLTALSGAPTAMALTSVRFASSTGFPNPALTTIDTYSVENCVNLTDFEFPSSLTSINASAFLNDAALKYCYTNPTQTSSDVVLGKLDLSGTKVTAVGANAFQNCSSLTSVVFPNTLTGSQGSYCFAGATSLASVTYNATSTKNITIGTYSFSGCSSLTSVALPTASSGTRTINDNAFLNCTGLPSIYIPSTVVFNHTTGSGTNAPFSGCTGMSAIYLQDNGTSYDSRKDTAYKVGWNYKNTNKTDYQIPFYCYAGPDDGSPRDTSHDSTATDMHYWHYMSGVPTPW